MAISAATFALPRLVALMALAAVSTAAVALAAGGETVVPVRPEPAAPARPTTAVLTVPDVRGQAHVFAKVSLEEAGYAWRVRGPVQGYASHVVAAQYPAPGTEILDTGQPTIVLRLQRVGSDDPQGRPENTSVYAGTPVYVVPHELVSPDRLGVVR